MITKIAKYNSRKSFILPSREDTPIRRRNLSLGSNPESQKLESSLSPNRVNNLPQSVYSSRKSRSIINSTKFKIMKYTTQNTKLCQQNILQYHKLKQKVKQNCKIVDNDLSPKKLQYSPKLSIKNLGMAVHHQFNSKNRSFRDRRHLNTEIIKELPAKKLNRDEMMPIKIPISIKKHSERYSLHLPSKKYNQMTLREIAEVDEGPKFNILMKLRQLKHKKTSKRSSRRPSEDYSLEGW